jgi:hypothetical protein
MPSHRPIIAERQASRIADAGKRAGGRYQKLQFGCPRPARRLQGDATTVSSPATPVKRGAFGGDGRHIEQQFGPG